MPDSRKIFANRGLRPQIEALLEQRPNDREDSVTALLCFRKTYDERSSVDALASESVNIILFGSAVRKSDAVRVEPAFQAWLVKLGLKEADALTQVWR